MTAILSDACVILGYTLAAALVMAPVFLAGQAIGLVAGS